MSCFVFYVNDFAKSYSLFLALIVPALNLNYFLQNKFEKDKRELSSYLSDEIYRINFNINRERILTSVSNAVYTNLYVVICVYMTHVFLVFVYSYVFVPKFRQSSMRTKLINLIANFFICFQFKDNWSTTEQKQTIFFSILHFAKNLSLSKVNKKSEQYVLNAIPEGDSKPTDKQIDIPNYLRKFARDKSEDFVKSAFTAMSMKVEREYLCQNNAILPLDFKSTGVVENNKKWGNGLHQFLEMKHRVKISPLSLVTNFMSNVYLFQKYGSRILGVSGTLGTQGDKEFMHSIYGLNFYDMPSCKKKRLLEYPGRILKNANDWKEAVGSSIKSCIDDKKAVLVICEDMSSLTEIQNHVVDKHLHGKHEPVIYARSDDPVQVNMITQEVKAGQVIIATNLAGRGTDVKLTNEILENGGLHVIVSFLPSNSRVERQAFGRAGRKGQPGSAEIISNKNSLPASLRAYGTICEAKIARDSIEKDRIMSMRNKEIHEVLAKEKVFEAYCKIIKPYMNMANDKRNHFSILINSLHETWAFWLQSNERRIKSCSQELLCTQLAEHMKPGLDLAKNKIINKSPYQNFYHVLLYRANKLAESDKNVDLAMKSFQNSIEIDDICSSIAHYNLAYCYIQKGKGDYLKQAKEHLELSLDRMTFYKTECMMTDQLVSNSLSSTFVIKDETGQTSLKN